MKVQEYVEKLYNENDFEESYVLDLSEDTPENLHDNIMKVLKDEKAKKNSIIKRRYLSLAAAIFIFAVLVSGLKNFKDIVSPQKAVEQKNLTSSNITSNVTGIADKTSAMPQDNRNLSKELDAAFEITTKESEIIEYLKSHGENAGSNLYLLDKKYYEEFRVILKEKNLSLMESKDALSKEDNKESDFKIDEFILIKILD